MLFLPSTSDARPDTKVRARVGAQAPDRTAQEARVDERGGGGGYLRLVNASAEGHDLEGAFAFRRILRNAGWTLLGHLVPLAVALALLPWLIGRIDTERFGLLSLAWVLIGYFSLFDLGVGRAMTKLVAQLEGQRRSDDLGPLSSTGLSLLIGLGLLGGALVAALLPLSGSWTAALEPTLRAEFELALLLVALAVPLAVVTAGLRGILEGLQRFRLLSVIRVFSGVALVAAPCVSAWITPRLDACVAALLLARVVVLAAHLRPCLSRVRIRVGAARWGWVRPLLHFGGWLTVSNVVGPVIVYVDRFAIGVVLSAAAVAHYVAPFEVVSRLLLIPVALTTALFPALAQLHARDPANPGQWRTLRRQSSLVLLAVTLPIAVLGALVAEPALRAWLGEDFAEHSSRVFQILLAGFVLNALAQIPFSALQSCGKTRATALLHLAQLPPYLVLLMWLIDAFGLAGAAAAWALRALVDLAAMSWLLNRIDREFNASPPRDNPAD